MTFARRVLLVSLLAALSFAGCKSDTAARNSESPGSPSGRSGAAPPPAAPVDPATAGTITGTVDFKGAPPPRVPIDMSMDPACAMAGQNLSEQYVIARGKVANVFVYLKRGAGSTALAPSSAAPGAPPVRIDQHGCRFIPHAAAVQQGGTVEFTNSDPTMHNVHTVTSSGNPSIDVSQGPGGQPQVRRFDAPENMIRIGCNNHPWMNAFLNVAPNPYFAITDSKGTFTIKGVPAGSYILAAVHEKLGEQDVEITVKPHDTTSAELTFGAQ